MTNRVFVLDTGIATCEKSLLTLNYREFGKTVKIPILTYLIKTNEENILVDTSFGSPERADLKAWGFERPLGQVQEPIVQLKNLGLEPDDVNIVVNTHLHNDHCGNNKLFQNSRFFIQKEELRHAFVPDENERDSSGTFCNRLDFDHSLDYQLMTGDYEVGRGSGNLHAGPYGRPSVSCCKTYESKLHHRLRCRPYGRELEGQCTTRSRL